MGVPIFYNELRHFSRSLRLCKTLAPFPSIFPDSKQFQLTKTDPNPMKSFTSSTSQTLVPGDSTELVIPGRGFRSFSASSRDALSSIMRDSIIKRNRSKPPWKKVYEIVDMIRRNENNLEHELNLINVSLTVSTISRIFEALNSEKVSALRFFNWIRDSKPSLRWNFDICSLVVDNFGRLNDYESMNRILDEFRREQICLTQNAFRFLPDLMLNNVSLMNSVTEVVRLLNGIGGSIGASGVRSLIEMFSCINSLEMARFVMQITETNTSYYNIMIREMCRQHDLEGAKGLLEEMRQVGCEPNTTSCNLVLSILCKNVQSVEVLLREMQDMSCSPDNITFEILVLQSCKIGRFDFALGVVDKMLSLGLEPRLSTHAALVKGYFASQRYEEAHKYVVDLSFKHGQSSNVVYSLLARLYLKKGDVVNALNIVLEMIDKGRRPQFPVYMQLLDRLQRLGRTDAAGDLKIKFSSLSWQITTESETGDL